MFANFTFEFLPVVTSYVFAILLHVALSFNPVLQTLEMNESDRAATFASKN